MRYNFKTRILESIGTSIWELPLDTNIAEPVLLLRCCKDVKMKVIQALNEAFIRPQSLGKVKLTVNPFFDLHKKVGANTKDKYKQTVTAARKVFEWLQIQDANEDEQERDRRAFTKEERNTIIKAFYESEKANECHAAPLIEFVFLTGCRPGEAFALRWQDVMLERGYIRFSKSYNGNLKNPGRI